MPVGRTGGDHQRITVAHLTLCPNCGARIVENGDCLASYKLVLRLASALSRRSVSSRTGGFGTPVPGLSVYVILVYPIHTCHAMYYALVSGGVMAPFPSMGRLFSPGGTTLASWPESYAWTSRHSKPSHRLALLFVVRVSSSALRPRNIPRGLKIVQQRVEEIEDRWPLAWPSGPSFCIYRRPVDSAR